MIQVEVKNINELHVLPDPAAAVVAGVVVLVVVGARVVVAVSRILVNIILVSGFITKCFIPISNQIRKTIKESNKVLPLALHIPPPQSFKSFSDKADGSKIVLNTTFGVGLLKVVQ